jgi:hypothetical protein
MSLSALSLSVSVSAPYLDFSPQVFYGLARYLKLNCQPVERIETDLSLHYPHGHLDDRQAVRMALQLSGGLDPPARDVLLVQQFLQKVVESPEGLLEDEANSQRKQRKSGVTTKRLIQWRDFVLVLRSLVSSYGGNSSSQRG